MADAVIGRMVGQLKVNLSMEMPTLFGVRAKIAVWLCNVAAFVLGGRLEVAIKPEMTMRMIAQDGRVISEQTSKL
jgi:hypothetical protein